MSNTFTFLLALYRPSQSENDVPLSKRTLFSVVWSGFGCFVLGRRLKAPDKEAIVRHRDPIAMVLSGSKDLVSKGIVCCAMSLRKCDPSNWY